jgi:hypothetical protein
MRFIRSLPVVAGLLLAGARPAAAAFDGDVSPLIARPHAVGLDMGVASAVGAIGVTFTHAFGETFRIETGLGAGFSGTQLSLMPKLVLGAPRDHFVTGVGIGYTIAPEQTKTAGNPVWLNVDALGYEHLFQGGFALAFAVGFTRGLGGGSTCVFGCEGDGGGKVDVRQLAGPQGRVGFAYWF